VVTKAQIAHLRSPAGGNNRNLRMVADISCDFQGSVEFLERFTSIEAPYFTYYPEHANEKEGSSKPTVSTKIDGNGILVLGVDNLPSELPRDASEHFGRALLPLIPPLLKSKGDAELSDLPPELQRACLFSGGQYRPKWSYIARLRETAEQTKAAQLAAMKGKNMASMKIELVVSEYLGRCVVIGVCMGGSDNS
jgi:alpha-aminoadipic semialdehyde synthase